MVREINFVVLCLFLTVNWSMEQMNFAQNPGNLRNLGNMGNMGNNRNAMPSFFQNFMNPTSGRQDAREIPQQQQPQRQQQTQAVVPSMPNIQVPAVPNPGSISQPGQMMSNPSPNVYGPLDTDWSTCPDEFVCCQQYLYRDIYSLLDCCNADSFDKRLQRCEDDQIVPIQAGDPTPTPATRLVRINCGGYLYVATPQHRCCNFAVYSQDTHICINGEVKVRPAANTAPLPYGSIYLVCASYRFLLSTQATLTWGCCNQDLYNWRKENCTAGMIEPERTATAAAQVPKGELMIFCAAKQHFINPDNLASTRCCGSEICPMQAAPVVLDSNADTGSK